MSLRVKSGDDLEIEQRPSLADSVYQRLRQAIVKGPLKPGTELVQAELAERMGVSRTPVSNAIDRLAHEGLVERRQGNRTWVAELSVESLERVYDIREVLEGLAARLACRRLSENGRRQLDTLHQQMVAALDRQDLQATGELGEHFHQLLVDHCGNALLASMLAQIQDQISRYRVASVFIPGRSHDMVGEHVPIMKAILDQDETLAEQLAREHVSHSRRWLAQALQFKSGD